MNRGTRTVVMSVLCTLGALMVGCAGYQIDVRNQSNKPITATVYKAGSLGDRTVLDTQWIGPGDRGSLGPLKRKALWVYTLQVDAPDNPGMVAKKDLDLGHNVFNVSREGPDDSGDIILEEID